MAVLATAVVVWIAGVVAIARFPMGKRPASQIAWVDELGLTVPDSTWKDPEGYTFRGCSGRATLSLLIDGQRVWTFCEPRNTIYNGALVAIDVEERIARLGWKFPDRYRFAGAEAIAPGPEPGAFALVYTSYSPGGLAVGVVGRVGWRMEPIGLENDGQRMLLGAEWVGDELEIALAHLKRGFIQIPKDTPDAASIVHVNKDGSTTKRIIERAMLCAGLEGCDRVDLAYRRDGQWRFFVSRDIIEDGKRVDKAPDVVEVAESGADRHAITLPSAVRYVPDIAPPNRLILAPRFKIEHDGRIVAIEPPAGWPGKKDFYLHGYRIEGKEIAPIVGWEKMTERSPSEYTNVGLDQRLVRTSDPNLSIVLLDPPKGALTKLGECGLLRSPAFVPRTAGGMWLVSTDGCFVGLTKDYDRVDAPSIFETALRAPDGWADAKKTYFIALVFALFGLPSLLLLAYVVFAKQPNRRRWALPIAAMAWLIAVVPAFMHLDHLR